MAEGRVLGRHTKSIHSGPGLHILQQGFANLILVLVNQCQYQQVICTHSGCHLEKYFPIASFAVLTWKESAFLSDPDERNYFRLSLTFLHKIRTNTQQA